MTPSQGKCCEASEGQAGLPCLEGGAAAALHFLGLAALSLLWGCLGSPMGRPLEKTGRQTGPTLPQGPAGGS